MSWWLIMAGGLGLYGAGALHGWAIGRISLLQSNADALRRAKSDLDQLTGRVTGIEDNYRPISTVRRRG